MANCLIIATYSCKGLGSGNKECISKLYAKHDLVLLPEDLPHEGDYYFDKEVSGIRSHTISRMDTLVAQFSTADLLEGA